ncbi:MAG: lanthionine synthetase LanC family protein, partial [Candidatus Brocadiia bacterium]
MTKRPLIALLIVCLFIAASPSLLGEEPTPQNSPAALRFARADLPEMVLARAACEWLLSIAKETPEGLCWPEYAEDPFTTTSLYSGTPGVLYALLNMYIATGEKKYADAARGAVKWIRAKAEKTKDGLCWPVLHDLTEGKTFDTRYYSLYSGTSGIAVALMEAALVLKDPAAMKDGLSGLKAAIARSGPVTEQEFGGQYPEDVISGAAGVILALLRGYELTGDESLLKAAVSEGAVMQADAETVPEGLVWPINRGAKMHYNGFSHGTAGVAYALARLYQFTGKPEFLAGAKGGAEYLLQTAVKDAKGMRWNSQPPQETGKAHAGEGWCHGIAGTARLFVLLYAIAGDPRYRAAVEDAFAYLVGQYKPKEDRYKSGFWSPSLCCGATGVGDFCIDLFKFTGMSNKLDYAVDVVGWLDRIAVRPDKNKAKWNLTPVADEKTGIVYHPTSLMLGVAGQVHFLARLASVRSGLPWCGPRPPDRMGLGGKSGFQEIVVLYGPDTDKYLDSASALADYRGALIARIPDASPAKLADLLKGTGVRYAALFASPATIDINAHRAVINALSHINEDPFMDASFGWLTGAAPVDPMKMLYSMAQVESEGLPPLVREVSVAQQIKQLLHTPPAPMSWEPLSTSPMKQEHYYFTSVGDNPKCREDVPKVINGLKGSGSVLLFGCGDPLRTWLFSDQRNMDEKLHWAYDPTKVIRDPNHPEMPGIGASDYANAEISPAVVYTGVCHAGVPCKALVEGDIVSTFGDTGGKSRYYTISPEYSFCLAMLARGPSAYCAPIGANHGNMAALEFYRAAMSGKPLGDVLARGYDDVAFCYWASLGTNGIPLEQRLDGEPEKWINVTGYAMLSNSLNRVLYGDPLYTPYLKYSPFLDAPLTNTVRATPEGMNVTLTMADPESPEYWDMYRGDGPNREHVQVILDVPTTMYPPISITAEATLGKEKIALTGGQWAVGNGRNGKHRLFLSVNAPA